LVSENWPAWAPSRASKVWLPNCAVPEELISDEDEDDEEAEFALLSDEDWLEPVDFAESALDKPNEPEAWVATSAELIIEKTPDAPLICISLLHFYCSGRAEPGGATRKQKSKERASFIPAP
jgi:hypothetical protein